MNLFEIMLFQARSDERIWWKGSSFERFGLIKTLYNKYNNLIGETGEKELD